MKYLWATLMVLGIIIAPSAGEMSLGWCIGTAVVGVAITVFSGERFCKEMKNNG